MSAKWYDSHENLHKLSEWLRLNRGWRFFKDNILDVLETPWSWEKEWRLANGDVHFVEYRPEVHEQHLIDVAKCDWCDNAIGYVTYAHSDGGTEIDWIPVYEDVNTGEVACDDCAGTAANFTETTSLTKEPTS